MSNKTDSKGDKMPSCKKLGFFNDEKEALHRQYGLHNLLYFICDSTKKPSGQRDSETGSNNHI